MLGPCRHLSTWSVASKSSRKRGGRLEMIRLGPVSCWSFLSSLLDQCGWLDNLCQDWGLVCWNLTVVKLLGCLFVCDSINKVIGNKNPVIGLLTVNLAHIHVLNTKCSHFQIVKDDPTKLYSFCSGHFFIAVTVPKRTSSGVFVLAHPFRG